MNDPIMFSILLHISDPLRSDPGVSQREHRPLVDPGVWRRVVDALPSHGFTCVLIDVGDAVAYETHPEISLPGAWSKEDFKNELDRMRRMGLTPYPKLNFSCSRDAWLKEYSRMPGTNKYRKVCTDLIREVWEMFGKPRYFHLGMDEEGPSAQRGLQFSCTRRNSVLWRDVFCLFHACESLGSTPWIWSDYHRNRPEEFFHNMPKSVLQCPRSRFQMPGGFPAAEPDPADDAAILDLDRAGYPYTLCRWDSPLSDASDHTMEMGRNQCTPDLLTGYLTDPRVFANAEGEDRLMDALRRFQKAKNAYYPE